MVDKTLLEILACPACKTPVVQEGEEIVCTNRDCRLRYPVRDGIPIMLVEEGRADARHIPGLAAGAAAGVTGDAATRLGAAKNVEEAKRPRQGDA